jgi:hypothetical protein
MEKEVCEDINLYGVYEPAHACSKATPHACPSQLGPDSTPQTDTPNANASGEG